MARGSSDESRWPPQLFGRGMHVAPFTQERPPGTAEQVWNSLYDDGRRLIRRPGSTFRSRIGTGAILGMHVHTFSALPFEPRLVAIVANPYATVVGLKNATDPAAGGGVGIALDCEDHGAGIHTFAALETDDFSFASVLDRLYWAGSSANPVIFYFDFAGNDLGQLSGIRSKGVVAYRQRLYSWGDPTNPNYLFPSEFGDPDTFRTELAVQVGSDNSRIVTCVEGLGILLVLTDRSAHQYLGISPELGELELDSADKQRGVIGRRAACLGGDGFFYWLDQDRTPCRWQPGMRAADTDFAGPVLPMFRQASAVQARSAAVRWDQVNKLVHFLLPTGGASSPNYLISFAPGIGWTHGASTEDLSALSTDFGISLRQNQTAGADLYADVVAKMDDRLTRLTHLYGGDASGYIWRWNAMQTRDKVRSSTAAGQAFKTLLRSGSFELAPIGFRAMIHRLQLDLACGTDFSLKLRLEEDYAGAFTELRTIAASTTLGLDAATGFVLNTDILARLELRPLHRRVGLWEDALAKVFRLELETSDPIAMIGVEGEYSTTAI